MPRELRADLQDAMIFPLVQLTFQGENHDTIVATHGLEQFLAQASTSALQLPQAIPQLPFQRPENQACQVINSIIISLAAATRDDPERV